MVLFVRTALRRRGSALRRRARGDLRFSLRFKSGFPSAAIIEHHRS